MSQISEIFNSVWIYLSIGVEVGILAVLIYYGLYFLRGTRAANVLAGIIIAILLLTLATDFLKFEVITELLNALWGIFLLALIVIFQPEIRRAFAHLGSSRPFARRIKWEETINEVVLAIGSLSVMRRGALIVFQRKIGMRALVSTGIRMDARVTHQLLQTIFNPASPLHDGAVTIENNRIAAAHCIFPLTQNDSLSHSLGTRHRAAIGVTEETDAVAVAVSEESGRISIAYRGNIIRDISTDKLSNYLRSFLVTSEKDVLMDMLEDFEGDSASAFSGGGREDE